jgi:flagellar protein FliJ
MGKFKFRLATLLRLREATRDERRAALADAYRVDELLGQRLKDLAREIDGLKGLCRRMAGPGSVDVDRLVEAQRYDAALRIQNTQLMRQRASVAAEIQRRRLALLEADRDVRVLEKLRDKQGDNYRRDQERQDVKRLDEVAQLQGIRESIR